MDSAHISTAGVLCEADLKWANEEYRTMNEFRRLAAEAQAQHADEAVWAAAGDEVSGVDGRMAAEDLQRAIELSLQDDLDLQLAIQLSLAYEQAAAADEHDLF